MHDERDQAIKVFLGMIKKRIDDHAEQEHKHVAEQNRQRVTHKKIHAAFAGRALDEIIFRHDRERADVRAAQLGVVIVMMVVRRAPDAAGAEREDSHAAHQPFRQSRLRQNRVMLLIVIDNEDS